MHETLMRSDNARLLPLRMLVMPLKEEPERELRLACGPIADLVSVAAASFRASLTVTVAPACKSIGWVDVLPKLVAVAETTKCPNGNLDASLPPPNLETHLQDNGRIVSVFADQEGVHAISPWEIATVCLQIELQSTRSNLPGMRPVRTPKRPPSPL